MKQILWAVMVMGLVGCASDPRRRNDGSYAWPVQVTSDPAGVKIEVNGDYVGDTPCTINLYGEDDGRVKGGRPMTVVANPSEAGQFSQSRTYRTGGWGREPDYLPKKIYFNMHLNPIGEKKTVDVNMDEKKH